MIKKIITPAALIIVQLVQSFSLVPHSAKMKHMEFTYGLDTQCHVARFFHTNIMVEHLPWGCITLHPQDQVTSYL